MVRVWFGSLKESVAKAFRYSRRVSGELFSRSLSALACSGCYVRFAELGRAKRTTDIGAKRKTERQSPHPGVAVVAGCGSP